MRTTLIPGGLLIAMSGSTAARALPFVLEPQAPPAEHIAILTWWMIAVFGLVFIVVMLLGAAGIRRRRGQERALSARASRMLVIGGGVAMPFLVIVALVAGSVLVDQAAPRADTAPALTVEVIGRQWWWEIRYLDRSGNVYAVTANEIHLPAAQPVRLLLRSADVIHTFWAPELDGKIDMIPGRTNTLNWRIDAPGTYRGQCAEFCGTQHTRMAFLVVVRPEPQFREWLSRQAQPAAAPALRQATGRRLFSSKGCAKCHRIAGTEAQGLRAPDLTHMATRTTLAAASVPNNRGHLAGWILDPHGIKPGVLMPPTDLSPAELSSLLGFLEALD